METPKQPHPGGRPTKYDPKFVEEVNNYLDSIKNNHKSLPTIEGFAEYIGVDHDTVNLWARKKLKDEQGNITKKLARPEFYGAIKRIKNLQKQKLIDDGLYGGKDVNSIMAIFLLKVNHGMIETNHTDVTTKNKPISLLGGVTNVPSDNSTS